jgi:hypothetical protein
VAGHGENGILILLLRGGNAMNDPPKDPLVTLTPKYVEYQLAGWVAILVASVDALVIHTVVTEGSTELRIALVFLLTVIDGLLGFKWLALRDELGFS